jgi:hypothetical protein
MNTGRSWTQTHNHDVSLLSTSQQTALPLPRSVKGNRSFANLAKLFGIGSGHPEEVYNEAEGGDEEHDVEEEADAVDEDSLMWDAQVRLPLYTHAPACRKRSHDQNRFTRCLLLLYCNSD